MRSIIYINETTKNNYYKRQILFKQQYDKDIEKRNKKKKDSYQLTSRNQCKNNDDTLKNKLLHCRTNVKRLTSWKRHDKLVLIITGNITQTDKKFK